jgi:hypothetical protein
MLRQSALFDPHAHASASCRCSTVSTIANKPNWLLCNRDSDLLYDHLKPQQFNMLNKDSNNWSVK